MSTFQKVMTDNKHPFVEKIFYQIGYGLTRAQVIVDSLYYNPFQKIKKARESEINLPREQIVLTGAKFFFEWVCIYGIVLYMGIKNTISSIKTSAETKNQINTNSKNIAKALEDIKSIREQICNMEQSMKDQILTLNDCTTAINQHLNVAKPNFPMHIRISSLEQQTEDLRKVVALYVKLEDANAQLNSIDTMPSSGSDDNIL
jgi:hypothetical protein